MSEFCDELKPYVKVLQLFITCLGHWPFQPQKQRIIFESFTGTLLLTYCIPLAIGFYMSFSSFDTLLSALPMNTTILILGWIYYFFYICERNVLQKLFLHVNEDYKTMRSCVDEFKILTTCAKEGDRVIVFFTGYILINTSFYCVVTTLPVILNTLMPLNESRQLKYIAEVQYLFFDREDHYFLVFFHNSILGSFAIFNLICFDLLLFFFTQHACGMFRVLKYRLKNIVIMSNIDEKLSRKEREKKLFETASACVNLYDRILSLTENIDSCFSFYLLFVIGIMSLIMSFQGAMIIMRFDDKDLIVQYAFFTVGQILHLMYNCITGQNVLDHSEDVTNNIYDFEWYEAPIKVQKLLHIMMVRSLRESQITIGKMSKLSFETFATIMKTIFSYLSVLSSLT